MRIHSQCVVLLIQQSKSVNKLTIFLNDSDLDIILNESVRMRGTSLTGIIFSSDVSRNDNFVNYICIYLTIHID